MCGIVGVISKTPVNQLIYDALLLLQHRGQDAAGIVTAGPDERGTKFFMSAIRCTPMRRGSRTDAPPPTKMPRLPSGNA